MVPGALEATARQFLGGSGSAPGSGSGSAAGSAGAGGVLARLPLRRDTLSPGSGTAYRVTTSQSFGLRLERHWPVTARTRGFVALRGGAGQQRYLLPQGLGPLTDPMQIGFLTGWIGTEIGLRHERILTAHPDTALRLSVSAGHDLTLTRTHLQSALVDVTNRHHEGRRHASLGLGLVWRPAGTGAEIEWQGAARVLQGGQRLFRSEWRLSY